MKLAIHSDFQSINPFAEQSPFLIFYNQGAKGRIYQANGLGCVTPDLFQASRYEIGQHDEKIGYIGDGLHTPNYVTIPVCVYRPSEAAEFEFYVGNHRIRLDPACGESAIHQAVCGAKKLARPTFRPGGPFGAVVQTAPHTGKSLHVAYFGIDLLFYSPGKVLVPDALEGFTRIGINHFASVPRYW